MHIESGTTVEVELENGKKRIGFVGSSNEIRNTSNATIVYIDGEGKKHRFKVHDSAHKRFIELGASGVPILAGNGGLGFPDGLQDATVFVLSRGKAIAYGSYREYLNCLTPTV